MNEDGFAAFSAIENLAIRARVTKAQAKSAIKVLTSPDPNSADPSNDGIRLERVPGGFIVLNAKRYQQTRSYISQREQTRLRVANFRAREKEKKHVTSVTALHTVSPVSVSVSMSELQEGEYEGEKPLGDVVGPVIQDALKWLAGVKKAPECDYTEEETRYAFLQLKANGFKWGQADWRAALERQIQWDRKHGPIRKDTPKAPEANQRQENIKLNRL